MRLLDEDRGFFTAECAGDAERNWIFDMKFFVAFVVFFWLCLPRPISLQAQSLAEAAHKESERRRSLEERGISGRVIEQHDTTQRRLNGNVSVFAPVPATRRAERPAPNTFRKALQVLDREIQQGEDRLALLKEKIQTARRAAHVPTRSSRSGSLQADLRECELKLKRLRQDRLDTYNAGRKAGFLPGELEGK